MNWLRRKINNFNIFEIGNSFLLYYFFIFYFTPVLIFISDLINPNWTTSKNWATSGIYYVNYITLSYLIFGIISFMFGYYYSPKFMIIGKLVNFLKLKSEWDYKKSLLIFWFFLISGGLIKILKIFGDNYAYRGNNLWLQNSLYYSLIGIFEQLSYVALIIALINYFYFKKNNNINYFFWRKLSLGAFIFEMAYALPSCNRTMIITPIIFYLIIKYYFSYISWWKIIFITLVSVAILFPLGNACRNPIILSHYFSDKENQVNIGSENFKISDNILNTEKIISDSVFSRINQSIVFSKIIEMNEPPLNGKSLLNFFISLGPPRFIWHNKPIITGGSDFGHRSGLLSPGVESTVGVTIIGDLYMNFRLAGIIIGMFFIGILLKFIYLFLVEETNRSLSGMMIYSIVWINIIKGMEDWIAPVYAGLVKIFVILLIIHFFLITKQQKTNIKNVKFL